MKPKKKSTKTKSKRPKMPKWFPVDDEMKELSAMLEKKSRTGPRSQRDPCSDTRVFIEKG